MVLLGAATRIQSLARPQHQLLLRRPEEGGYHLARPPTLISLADVIQAIDGPVMLTACSDADESCDQYCKCSVRDPLWRLQDRITQLLAAFTIQELASDDAPGPFALSVTARPAPGSPYL